MIDVHIPYSPRKQFLPLHERTQRWGIAVCHRRAGKTVSSINELIKGALTCKLKNPRFAYMAPFRGQAKDVAWGYLKEFTQPIPRVQLNESELRCDLPNGGRVRLYGADNYDSMRGLYFDGVLLDEFGDMDPRAWSEVIRPALSDRNGWGLFVGTPRGSNHFASMWKKESLEQGWFRLELKASQTGLLSDAELADARRQMSEDQYAAEYECSFDAPVIGAYYGREMAALDKQDRITGVPWEPRLKVHTAWDLGVGDSTAIWFCQMLGKETRLIDFLEDSGKGLDFYANALKSRPYVYGSHYVPHDAEARELGTGKSRIEVMRSLGIDAKVLPMQRLEDGINAARNLLPGCWFDKVKCDRGIDALRNYRREWDDKRKVFHDRPLHDWSSHASDAFRYLAEGSPQDNDGWAKPLSYPKRSYV